ncbi:MAG: hypothetical protein LBK61_05760 [Spirochaetaceae bacterium]|jgi:hypothetical protein|nr:hypothetical protein [Spirochaetaceae bacterium]
MKKLICICFVLFSALTVSAQSNKYVTLGADDGGRYFNEKWDKLEYKPGDKVYPNTSQGVYRVYFFIDDGEWERYANGKDKFVPFSPRCWMTTPINSWNIDISIQPEAEMMSPHYIDFTIEQFQQLIDRFPVYLDQLYI